ncbi:unnamed protein product [Gongylonema pulchrum]|uniref:Secreted protein n=1 Tax=Gongylonema pulchrum TaxID=637853 RepID=A0A183DM79_9BILA|nr:unnamed protein product [Gongylonema pulchrum]
MSLALAVATCSLSVVTRDVVGRLPPRLPPRLAALLFPRPRFAGAAPPAFLCTKGARRVVAAFASVFPRFVSAGIALFSR